MPNINEYIEIIKDDISNDDVKFATFYFSVLGITEEVMELEETYTEDFENKTEIINEAGDVIFYCFQLVNRLNVSKEFIQKFNIENYKLNTKNEFGDFLLDLRSKSVLTCFYQMRKYAGKIVGMTKKIIRTNDKLDEKKCDLLQAYTSEIIINTFRVLNLLGLSIDICLTKNLEKREIRLKEYKKQIEENLSKKEEKKSTKKPSKKKEEILEETNNLEEKEND